MTDLNEDQAIQQLRGLPPDRQKAILARIPMERKQVILTKLQGQQQQPWYDRSRAAQFAIGAYEGAKGMAQYPFQAAKPRSPSEVQYGPVGRLLLHTGEDVYSGLAAGAEARRKAAASGEGMAGQTLATLEQYPMIGHVVQQIEKSGPGYGPATSPEAFRGYGEATAYMVAPKVGEKAFDSVTGLIKPEALRERAAKLNTKVLKTADPARRGYAKDVGLQVAQEHIVATARTLPDKIEVQRVAKEQQAMQAADAATKAGKTVDVTNEVAQVISEARQVMARRGQVDANVVKQMNQFIDQLTTKYDPATLRPTLRNLRALTPNEIVDLTRHNGLLGDWSEFNKSRPDVINNMSRRVRTAIESKLNTVAPEVNRLRIEESRLIQARDAARDNYAAILNDRGRTMRGLIYSGAGPLAAYAILRTLGAGWMTGIAGVVVARTLAQSVPSRTARAALYAYAADLVDTAVNRAHGATAGPTGTAGGGSALAPTQPPGGPQRPTPQAAARTLGTSPPFAPAEVVSTNPFIDVGPAMPPPPGRRWTADRGSIPGEPAYFLDGDSDTGRAAIIEHQNRSGTKSKFEAVIISEGSPKSIGVFDSVKEAARKAEVEADLESKTIPGGPSRSVAESSTVSPRNKAMLDRLDTLYERQAHPKSGADRNAIEREIAEIKRALSPDATAKERSAINKRIADRERLAAKRAEAGATTAPVSTGVAGEAVSQAASPELRAIALDAGYKKLASYDGGPEMVKAMRKMAKDMSKIDPNWDEAEQLTLALEALEQASKHTK